jgi:Fe-S oxidoreductase
MVAQAKARAGALLDALLPFAQAGIAIVGLEPSCLLTLRDESLAMGLGEKAVVVASQALLFEEFVAREAKAGRFGIAFARLDAQVVVHGHCHQKAFGAAAVILDVLSLVPGVAPEMIESSCCGMAGAFGYEARHHDISMQMAEASLLPAVRAAPDAIVVADGTSCRHQIEAGAGRVAIHAARLLERALPQRPTFMNGIGALP